MAVVFNHISNFIHSQYVADVVGYGKVLEPLLSLYKPISLPVSIVKGSVKTFALGSQLYDSSQAGQSAEVIRYVKAVEPLFSLYKPISLPISIVKRSIKTIALGSQLYGSNKEDFPIQLLQTTFSIIILIGTVFAHPLRKGLKKGKSLTVESKNLFQHLKSDERVKASEACANIVKDSLYFAILLSGSYQLILASFALKTVLRVYYSQSEFEEGNYLESAKHLALATAKVVKQILSR
jgi:hypothetical protein